MFTDFAGAQLRCAGF